MLKITAGNREKDLYIKSDLYIPLDIIIGDGDYLQPTVYWRMEDGRGSLLEIGFKMCNKEICSITLVECKTIHEVEEGFRQVHSVVEGCPKVMINGLEENVYYINEEGEMDIYVSGNDICIIFSRDNLVGCIKNRNAKFLLNEENELIGLLIRDIDKNEADILKNCF